MKRSEPPSAAALAPADVSWRFRDRPGPLFPLVVSILPSDDQKGLNERGDEIASAKNIGDALLRAQTALATMRARNHAGASGRWCRCDTARLHFFHHKGLSLIHVASSMRCPIIG